MEVIVFAILLVVAFPIVITIGGLMLGLLGGVLGLFASIFSLPFALLGAIIKVAMPLIILAIVFSMFSL